MHHNSLRCFRFAICDVNASTYFKISIAKIASFAASPFLCFWTAIAEYLPADGLGETRLHKITFSTKWPPRTHTEGGQVEPLLGCFFEEIISSTTIFVCANTQ